MVMRYTNLRNINPSLCSIELILDTRSMLRAINKGLLDLQLEVEELTFILDSYQTHNIEDFNCEDLYSIYLIFQKVNKKRLENRIGTMMFCNWSINNLLTRIHFLIKSKDL